MQWALIGSAPSSVRIAPYRDPAWKIIGCSPGVYGVAQRIDVWVELHRVETSQPWFSPEYVRWMETAKFPIFMAEKMDRFPTSQQMPVDYLVEKYSAYFFTSSLSWMFAMAIEAIEEERKTRTDKSIVDKIALYGVDMSANEEWGYQRAGCQYFGLLARSMGIEVGVPPESDLFRPAPLYGIDEITHGGIKLLARRRELELRLQQVTNEREAKTAEVHFLRGALDNHNYMVNTWIDRSEWVAPPALGVPLLPAFTPSLQDAAQVIHASGNGVDTSAGIVIEKPRRKRRTKAQMQTAEPPAPQ